MDFPSLTIYCVYFENYLVDVPIPIDNILMKLIHQGEGTKKNQSKNRGTVK